MDVVRHSATFGGLFESYHSTALGTMSALFGAAAFSTSPRRVLPIYLADCRPRYGQASASGLVVAPTQQPQYKVPTANPASSETVKGQVRKGFTQTRAAVLGSTQSVPQSRSIATDRPPRGIAARILSN